MPKFVRSNVRVRARFASKLAIPMEKFETAPQLGRFTLRDEGKTIASGTILRYKPYRKDAAAAQAAAAADLTKKLDMTKLTTTEAANTDKNEALVFDMETGQAAAAGANKMDAIAEGDEDAE